MYYQTLGHSTKPPLLFLHGFMGRGDDWQPIAHSFCDDYYCLLPDLPGHGDSPLPSTTLGFATLATMLVDWWDKLGLGRVTVVGYSMGGRLAVYSAVHYPKRIKQLILESCHPGLTEGRSQRVEWDRSQARLLQQHDMMTFVEHWYGLSLFQSLSNQPRLLDRLKKQRQQNNPAWLAEVIQALSPGRQPALWSQLPYLSMPVHLITGALDTKYVNIMTNMHNAIPQATLDIIPQAGHNVHFEQPQPYLACLEQYLA